MFSCFSLLSQSHIWVILFLFYFFNTFNLSGKPTLGHSTSMRKTTYQQWITPDFILSFIILTFFLFTIIAFLIIYDGFIYMTTSTWCITTIKKEIHFLDMDECVHIHVLKKYLIFCSWAIELEIDYFSVSKTFSLQNITSKAMNKEGAGQ